MKLAPQAFTTASALASSNCIRPTPKIAQTVDIYCCPGFQSKLNTADCLLHVPTTRQFHPDPSANTASTIACNTYLLRSMKFATFLLSGSPTLNVAAYLLHVPTTRRFAYPSWPVLKMKRTGVGCVLLYETIETLPSKNPCGSGEHCPALKTERTCTLNRASHTY